MKRLVLIQAVLGLVCALWIAHVAETQGQYEQFVKERK